MFQVGVYAFNVWDKLGCFSFFFSLHGLLERVDEMNGMHITDWPCTSAAEVVLT